MTPKEQKLDYFYKGYKWLSISEYISILVKDGYVVHQIIPDGSDSFYILLYKY